MARWSRRRTGTAAPRSGSVPGRGKAFVQVTVVSEHGFTLQYAQVEVPSAAAQATIRQLYFGSEGASTPEQVEHESLSGF